MMAAPRTHSAPAPAAPHHLNGRHPSTGLLRFARDDIAAINPNLPAAQYAAVVGHIHAACGGHDGGLVVAQAWAAQRTGCTDTEVAQWWAAHDAARTDEPPDAAAVTRLADMAAKYPRTVRPKLAASPDPWPTPQPIPSTLTDVAPFDAALLPAALRPWIVDIAERMQCPPDFAAVGAMVALSSIIGRRACIAPKRHDDWHVVPNLWGAVVGRPGVMKSPALAEVLKPVTQLQARARKDYEAATADHEINEKLGAMAVKEAEVKAQKLIRAGDEIRARQAITDAADRTNADAPTLRRYIVTDASVEALGEILIDNPWGVLAYRDELTGLLRSMDRDGQEGARAFYLQAYDGNQGYTFDRIVRGRNLHIPAVCVAMLGGIQPAKLQAYIHDAVTGGAGDDGLLQRFGLLVWPDISTTWANVDRPPDMSARQAAIETFNRVDRLTTTTAADDDDPAPAIYRFTPDAQDEFDRWRLSFEATLRSEDHHPAIESHLAKYRKLVPALALVCALADGEDEVGHASFRRALKWCDYLRSHAERAYGAGTCTDTNAASALLAKITAGKVQDGFGIRDVYLKGWSRLSTPESVHLAAALLVDLDHLQRVDKQPGPNGGRPSAIYRINPATLRGSTPQ